jgi:hypothetical protein
MCLHPSLGLESSFSQKNVKIDAGLQPTVYSIHFTVFRKKERKKERIFISQPQHTRYYMIYNELRLRGINVDILAKD